MDTSNRFDKDPDPVFHERTNVLLKEGYRGFKITQQEQHLDGVKITATNKKGKVISSSGNTQGEALKKVIDKIDLLLEK